MFNCWHWFWSFCVGWFGWAFFFFVKGHYNSWMICERKCGKLFDLRKGGQYGLLYAFKIYSLVCSGLPFAFSQSS